LSATVSHSPAVEMEGIRLHRLLTAYLSSTAIFAALELGVFDALAQGPGTAEELAARVGIPERPARVLLLALLGDGLVSCAGDRYASTPVADTYLVSGGPKFLGRLIAHQNTHYGKFTDLAESLRANQAVTRGENYSAAFGGTDGWAVRLAEVFRSSAQLQAGELAGAAAVTGPRHLVDLGCGAASYSIAMALANPELKVTGVDSPPVAAAARACVADAGLAGRVTLVPGDIGEDAFPDADVVLLSHVLSGYSREHAAGLLRHVHGWLKPGGELLVHDHFPSLAEVPFPYQLGLIMMVNNTRGGEVHSEAQVRQWLAGAGFSGIESRAVTGISGLVRARR
jgi:SAM-dependent methyltransferase